MKKIAIAASVALSLSGCATIFEGGNQPVTLRSVPSGANVVISNREGEKVHSGVTPATVTLKRGAGYFKSENYTVVLTKDGYRPQTIHVTGSVNGWYVANILFGGLIGLLIVDPATGAMYDLKPHVVDATLAAQGVSFKDGERALTVILAEDLPVDLWPQARRIDAN